MKRIIFGLVALALLVSSAAAQTYQTATQQIASLSGNGLVNFFNAGLQTNGHKKIIVGGNSTVWNATSYYPELCNSLNAANVLSNLGLTPCTTTISGYQVFDTAGSVQITFTGSTPAGYTVGDLVLSQPSNPALNTLIGTGVVTAVGGTTINYTMLPTNPFPAVTAFTSSGGTITNSLANLGENGATSVAIGQVLPSLLATYAKPGDLVLIRGPLINDVRLGACNLACATANVKSLYNLIVAAIPSTTDIAWKTENSLLTTDPTSSGLVSPLASSAAYTKIMQNAVFQAFSAVPTSPNYTAPRAVVWDNMQLVYTKLGAEYATSTWMTDILHPDGKGQVREAAADAEILVGLASGKGFPFATMQNPYSNTGTNGALLNGNPSWLANVRSLVGFSSFMEEHAMANNYGAPWTLYPEAVLDTERYDIVAYGEVDGSSATLVQFSMPAVNGSSPIEVQSNDLIWLQGSGVVQVPSSFSQAALNTGGTVYGYQLSNLGSIVPASAYVGQPMAIVRQHTYSLADVPYYADRATYTYRHRVLMSTSGTNFLRLSFQDGTPSWPTGMTTADTLVLPCGTISLSGASFSQISTSAQINVTGSWAACTGQSGWIFGTHALEANASYSGALNQTIGSFSPTALSVGELAFGKITASGTAPGAGGSKMEFVCGTTAGSGKLIVYGGTSTTPVTILDNIGTGVTGC